jgi:hypothetical protein
LDACFDLAGWRAEAIDRVWDFSAVLTGKAERLFSE